MGGKSVVSSLPLRMCLVLLPPPGPVITIPWLFALLYSLPQRAFIFDTTPRPITQVSPLKGLKPETSAPAPTTSLIVLTPQRQLLIIARPDHDAAVEDA